MRKNIKNEVIIQGRVYDSSKLAEKVVQNKESANFGKPFIGGSIDVATDEEGLNVVTVYFTYVTPMTAKGTENRTYTALKKIIDGGKTILNDGMEAATKVRIDTSIALNDFYTDREGEETLVSAKRLEGGFVTIVNTIDEARGRNKFTCDMLMNGVKIVEADPEKNIAEDYMIIKGAVFNFRGAILPVEFILRDKGGMRYFESLDISSKNMVFQRISGVIVSQTTETIKEEEVAFGEPIVHKYTKTVKEWVMTNASNEFKFEVGDPENGITEDEIKKCLSDREVYLAAEKKRQDDYKASKAAAASTAPSSVTASVDSFNW